ncbi:putative 3-deoxy-D-manno-octulosonic acid transferase mitochondrial [Zea mays]|uniref:Putative 3-deoxy-D-manno-octulosonic acid transferase mitochondrial n=1 Tax=Zea mays TaxID=4577 RepID=C0PM68_MAIZE|nr:unknown [Zea mays]ONM36326.1 putative 3-deoxy-D-manno-octulosonic acid transferase mitochondrial [Zea mays]|eukprot:NP_001170218.1 uncharacterized protein LOC100384169 [Zea mays]
MRPTRAASRGGWALYELYRTTSRVAAPAVLLWRRLQGLEHPTRWPERLGRPSAARPRPGSPLVWFHAVSLGEGMAALPIVRHCVRLRPGLPVLFTTTTLSSSEVIMDLLPDGVIYQFAPLDCPTAIDSFIGYWKPSLVLLLESELWPNLIMSAAAKGIAVALLNARISLKSFNHWSMPLMFPLVSLMLSKLSLVVPLVSTHGNADVIFMYIYYCCHYSFLIITEYYSSCSFSAATYTTRNHTFCWRFKIWYTQVLSSLS